jgi:hypothetical protein
LARGDVGPGKSIGRGGNGRRTGTPFYSRFAGLALIGAAPARRTSSDMDCSFDHLRSIVAGALIAARFESFDQVAAELEEAVSVVLAGTGGHTDIRRTRG